MKAITLDITGMSCGHCVHAVSEALKETPGVRVQKVDIGSARIEVDDDTAAGAAIEAVRDAGYEAEPRA
ncbi:MAG TPA: cation transporter [Gemmatimonadaceae bacterium]